ncbi:MAG: nucleotide exchange factor GrpE [Cyanobacteriota bacterium]|nr:nucleotide exchange factor GrpE [Cyanobacteriota bacterium]
MSGDIPPAGSASPEDQATGELSTTAPVDGDAPAADSPQTPEQESAATAPEDSSGAGGSGGDRLAELEAELAALRAEHQTLQDQYMRIAADFDNFRKRQSRDQDDLRLQITCSTLSEILPVVDNFDRARQQLNPQGEEAQVLHRSYQGLYRQLVDVFKQLGVSPMRVEGEPFDPSLHEAVLREPSEQHPEDVVTEELQRGYHLNGRVLRHALVKVSMGPGPEGGAADSGGGERHD